MKFLLKSVLLILKTVLYGAKLFLLLFVLVTRGFLIFVKAAVPSESETVTTQPATPPMEQQPTTPEQTTPPTEAPATEDNNTPPDTDDRGNPADGSPVFEITFNIPQAEYVGYDADLVARLCSEEEITDYIAGMMVLEVEPYFYIECAGVYQGNSVEFYGFRCYR